LDSPNARFTFETITGQVAEVTHQNIVLHAHSHRILPLDDLTDADPGGLSGGPVYSVHESGGQADLYLIGFITEYYASGQRILAKHSDVIRSDGTIQSF